MACRGVRGTEYISAGISPFEGGHHYPYHSLASGQTTGREQSPTHQQKIGLKINWVQFSSVAQSCPTLCNSMDCSMPGLPVHHQLLEFTQSHVHWIGDAIQPHLILCCPLLLPPSIFPSIRAFSNESVLHIRCPKHWSFSLSISPSNEYSGLISLRTDWLDLLATQGTLKSILQHYSSKTSILLCSAFFIIQLSHPYMTTEKTIALTRKNKRVPEKHLLLIYWLHQSLWLCGSQQNVEILKKMGILDHLTWFLRNLYADQKAIARTEHGKTSSKLGKVYAKAAHCHPAYLTYM